MKPRRQKNHFVLRSPQKKKKIRLAHLRKKREKKPEEADQDDKYDNLLKQDEILKEVEDFKTDLYRKRITNPVSTEIVDTLGPNAIKKLTELELKNTEVKITME